MKESIEELGKIGISKRLKILLYFLQVPGLRYEYQVIQK